jgi:hypothetical protein
MKLIGCVCLFCGLCAVMVACSNRAQPTEPSSTVPSSINTSSTQTSQTPEATPLSLSASLLQKLPKCDGIQILDDPIKFDWPNIDERLQELTDAQWGYYSCPGSTDEVAPFYRERMPKPPFNQIETNWVERTEGSVGVYYNGSTTIWTYLWVVPQPEDSQKSYVIVAESLEPVQGECRLDQPLFKNDIAEWVTQWSLE